MFNMRIIEIVKNRHNIIDGFKNWILRDEEIEELARQRLDVCSECKHNNNGKCGLCGCILEAKVRSPKEKCPKDKW